MSHMYKLGGFQPSGAPHWSVAIIEALDEEAARRTLLAILTDPDERPETVLGWDEDYGEPWQDPENWSCWPWTSSQRFTFVIGGGCR